MRTYTLALAPALALSTSVAHTMYNSVVGLQQKVEGSIGLVQQRFQAQDDHEDNPCEADTMSLVMPCNNPITSVEDIAGCSGVCASFFGEVMTSMVSMSGSNSGSDSRSASDMFDAIFAPMCRETACVTAILALEQEAATSAACIAAGGPESGHSDDDSMANMEEMLEFVCAVGPNGDTCAQIIFGMMDTFENQGSDSGSAPDECTLLADVGCCLASFASIISDEDGDMDISSANSTCPAAFQAALVPCESPFEDRTFLATTINLPGCTANDVGELQTDLATKFGCPPAQSSVQSYTASAAALQLTFRCETTEMTTGVDALAAAMDGGINPATDLPVTQAQTAGCGGSAAIPTQSVEQTQSPGSPASALVVSGFVMAGLALF